LIRQNCSINLTIYVSLQRAKEVSEALKLAIRYMETTRVDLKQFFINMSPAVSEDEFSYRIQEGISVLKIDVEEAWEVFADHPPPLEVYWDHLNKIDE
jgi:hypothetical protein